MNRHMLQVDVLPVPHAVISIISYLTHGKYLAYESFETFSVKQQSSETE